MIKIGNDLIKIIGFMVACILITDYMRYYITASHFSIYSIIVSIAIQVSLIFILYKGFIE
jgi:hypothetical protein